MGEQSGDKTEEPTPHKLKEARDKGQIAKSKEVTTAFLMLASYATLYFTIGNIWGQLSALTKYVFEQVAYPSNFNAAFAGNVLFLALRAFAASILPLMAIAFVIALVVEALQTGFVISGDPLSPKLERINPFEGLKRMVSLQVVVELFKSLVKIGLVSYITWTALSEDLPFVVSVMDAQPWDAMVIAAQIAFKVAMRIGILFIIVAVLDYYYKLWEYNKNLKMTKQEVKEEYKRLEGDPLIKQRIRELQRQAAYQRMMGAVPGADVVVTNPIHLAVALKYDASKMRSPTVVAKGKLIIADEIKKIAREHSVPVIENQPLAQELYKTTKVGHEIPGDLYQAVAEVLAFVYKIRKERTRKNKESLGPERGRRAVQTAARS